MRCCMLFPWVVLRFADQTGVSEGAAVQKLATAIKVNRYGHVDYVSQGSVVSCAAACWSWLVVRFDACGERV